jgi:hypothetical protein
MAVSGFHRTPVIIFSGILGSSSLFFLTVVPLTAFIAVIFMFGVNLSISSPDVMIDASVAEKVQQYPKFGSDLQSLCWGSMAFGSMLGYGSSGILIQVGGPRMVFGILIIFSVLVFICGSLGWFGEPKATAKPTSVYCRIVTWYAENYNQNKELFKLALAMSAAAFVLAVLVIVISDWYARFAILLLVGSSVPGMFYYVNKRDGYTDVANCGLYLFLNVALTPDITTTMFYWYAAYSNANHIF